MPHGIDDCLTPSYLLFMTRTQASDPLLFLRHTVKRMIAERGYTAVERFAHEHRIQQSILSRFLSGERGITLSTFLKIALALEMDLGPWLTQSNTPASLASPVVSYSTPKQRRGKVTIMISETKTIELKRNADDTNPVVLRLD